MIILGIILVFAAWAIPQILPDIPPGIDNVVGGLGWLLIVLGVILFILAFLGVGIGRGLGAGPRGRRYWY
jgi:hypothetical protein